MAKKMAQVTRRPQAETDILEIWTYIAEGSIADKWQRRPTHLRAQGRLT